MRCACCAVPRSLTVAPGAAVATAALPAHRIAPTTTPFTSACTVAVHWQASMVEVHPSRYDLLRRLTRQGMVLHLTAAMTVCVQASPLERDGAWHHLAFRYSNGPRSGRLTIFVDGDQQKSTGGVSGLKGGGPVYMGRVGTCAAELPCGVPHSLNHAHVHVRYISLGQSARLGVH